MADANAPVTVRIGSGETVSLTEGQDYQLRYRVEGVQRKDRYARMGFSHQTSPPGAELVFSARGPDRSTSDRYGGTQHYRAEWLLAVTPVRNDPALRYVGDYFAPPRGSEAEPPARPRPQRGVPLLPPVAAERPLGLLLPQHLNDAGAWCAGSGQQAATGGRCPRLMSCAARLPLDGARTDPGGVLEAALAYGVRALLASGPDLLPPCAVPLDPEPESIKLTPGDNPYTTVVTVTYPGGDTHRVHVTVETEAVTRGAAQ